jgi:hypothetical protein
MGNQIVAKPIMYCTNCHHTNHNMETYRSKRKEEPTIAPTEATSKVDKFP